MNKLAVSLLLSGVIAAPSAVATETPSFSFVDVNYNQIDFDGDFDSNGFGLKGSVELGQSFFAELDYVATSGDIEGFDFDVDTLAYGLGYKSEFGDSSAWFVSYNLGDWEIESESFDVDTLALGLRSNVSDVVELRAAITSNDVEDGDRENGYNLGLSVDFSNNTAFILDYNTIAGDVDLSIFKVGVRWTF